MAKIFWEKEALRQSSGALTVFIDRYMSTRARQPGENYLPLKWQFTPEKFPSQKERIVFQPSIFRCELLVSGRVTPQSICLR